MLGSVFDRPRTRTAALIAAPVACGALVAFAAAADDIVVPTDVATIQQAIDRARLGDRVIVEPGTYSVNLLLRSQIDVRGRETARVILEPRDPSAPIATANGIQGALLANVTLTGGTVGVQVNNSAALTIASTVFDSVNGIAVQVDGASGVQIGNNTFAGNATAIIRGSTAARVTNNVFENNINTIRATGGQPDAGGNIAFNCFFRNADANPALGLSFQLGDPKFVDPAARDFHLQEGSACIDIGNGTDVIDASAADAGAYGGGFSDLNPLPVAQVAAVDASTGTEARIDVSWHANLDYHVSNSITPGGYRLHYALNAAPPPFDGRDAGGGTQPSPIDVGNVTRFTLAALTPAAPAPAAPQLTSASPRQNAMVLGWTAADRATSYRVLYGRNAVTENQVNAGNATTVTVTGLTDGVQYRFAVAAVAQARYSIAVTALDNTPSRHESALSETEQVVIGPMVTGPTSNELLAIPGPTTPVPDLPDEGGCFIATSAYGSESAAPVEILREFRDRFLQPHALGRAVVRAYYAVSPDLARRLDARPTWKPLVRGALAPIVGAALVLVAASATQTAAIALLLGMLVICRRGARRTPAHRSGT